MKTTPPVLAGSPQAGGEIGQDGTKTFLEQQMFSTTISDTVQATGPTASLLNYASESSGVCYPHGDRYKSPTNDFSDTRIPNFGIDTEGTFTHDPQPTNAAVPYDDRNHGAPIRGGSNYGEEARNLFWSVDSESCDDQLFSGVDCQYKDRAGSTVPAPETAAPMFSRYSNTKNAPARARKPSQYTPFQGLFTNSESARNFRKEALRFDRKPHRPPDSDPTIWKIEAERQNHVKDIYDAMIRSDVAKDNPKSNAMRRWVEEPFYDPAVVEAYAHRILDCLLDQAKEGFRGWKHDDYTQDERKGEVEDMEVSCEERLANIICALEQEKTICEDVMNSACQIRMFVNAPKAYAGRKLNNRVGNSKRKRARDPAPSPTVATNDEITRASKSRKPNTRPAGSRKAHSSLSRGASTRDCETTQPPLKEETPQHRSPLTQNQLASSPALSYLAPNPVYGGRYTPTESTGVGNQHHVNAMSPPQSHASHASHIPRIASMPPQQDSPFLSPPPLSHYSASVPATPDIAQSVNPPFEFTFQQPGSFGYLPFSAIDPNLDFASRLDSSLFDETWSWPQTSPNPPCVTPGPLQIRSTSEQGICPIVADPSIEQGDGDGFQRIWNTFSGVQQYPNSSSPGLDPNLGL